MMHVHMAQERGDMHADIAGRGVLLIQQILKQRPRMLHHIMAWATFTQAWPGSQVQHDVGEFLTFC